MANKHNTSHSPKHGQDRTCNHAAAHSLKQGASKTHTEVYMLSNLQLVSLVRAWPVELRTPWQVQVYDMSYIGWNGINYTSLMPSPELLYILLLHCCIFLHLCITEQGLGVSSSCQGLRDDEI